MRKPKWSKLLAIVLSIMMLMPSLALAEDGESIADAETNPDASQSEGLDTESGADPSADPTEDPSTTPGADADTDVEQEDLSGKQVTVAAWDQVQPGSLNRQFGDALPAPGIETITVGADTLHVNTDYTVAYSYGPEAAPSSAGHYTVSAVLTMTSACKYKGSYTTPAIAFDITPRVLNDATKLKIRGRLGSEGVFVYDGAKHPSEAEMNDLRIEYIDGDFSYKLIEGRAKDYTVVYSVAPDAASAGAYTLNAELTFYPNSEDVVLDFKDNTATTSRTFDISPLSLTDKVASVQFEQPFTYNGSMPAVQVAFASDLQPVPSANDYTVTVADDGTNADVGSHTVSVTVEGKGNYTGSQTLSATYEITKAPASEAAVMMTADAQAKVRKYDGTEQKLGEGDFIIIVTDSLKDGYSVSYEYPSADYVHAGEKQVVVKITPDANHTLADEYRTFTFSYTIAQRAVKPALTLSVTSFMDNVTADEVRKAALISWGGDGVLEADLAEMNKGIADGIDAVDWQQSGAKTIAPSFDAAKVQEAVLRDYKVDAMEPVAVNVAASKRVTLNLSAAATAFVYGDAPVLPQVLREGSMSDEDLAKLNAHIEYAKDGQPVDAITSTTPAGTYDYKLVYKDVENYKIAATVTAGTLTIEPRPVRLVLTPVGRTSCEYGATAPEYTIELAGGTTFASGETAASALQAKVLYKSANGLMTYQSASSMAGVLPGTYGVFIDYVDNPNYVETVVSSEMTVTKRKLIVTADDLDAVYGRPQTLTYQITGKILNQSEEIAIRSALSLSVPEDAFTSDEESVITLAFDGENTSVVKENILTKYDIVLKNGTLKITEYRTVIGLDSAEKEFYYGDEPSLPVMKEYDAEAMDQLKPVIVYRNASGEKVGTISDQTPAGKYTYTLEYNQDTDYTVEQGIVKGVLTIKPRPVTLSVTAKGAAERFYGDADGEYTIQVVTGNVAVNDAATSKGLAKNETLDTLGARLVIPTNMTSPVGVYTVTAVCDPAKSKNYAVTVVPATLTVKARPVTLTVNAEKTERFYGDSNPAMSLNWSANAMVNGDDLKASVVCNVDAATPAGTYTISASYDTANKNYAVTVVPTTLTVKARPAVLTVNVAESKRFYGNVNPAMSLTWSDKAIVNGDDLKASVVCDVAPNTPVGTYTITASYDTQNQNYAVTVVPATLEIVQRPVFVTVRAKSKFMGTEDPELNFDFGPVLVEGEDAASVQEIFTADVAAGTLKWTGALAREAVADEPESGHEADPQWVGSYAIKEGTLALEAVNYALYQVVPSTLTIAYLPLESAGEPKMSDAVNGYGWYTSDVHLVPPEGYEIAYQASTNVSDYTTSLRWADTSTAGTTPSYSLRRLADGATTNTASLQTIKKDTVPPVLNVQRSGASIQVSASDAAVASTDAKLIEVGLFTAGRNQALTGVTVVNPAASTYETKYTIIYPGTYVVRVTDVAGQSVTSQSMTFVDNDGDGLCNEYEIQAGSDPELQDTDHDGLSDYDELLKYHSNPNSVDTDGDNVDDPDEVYYGLDINSADTSEDGLLDEDYVLMLNNGLTDNQDVVPMGARVQLYDAYLRMSELVSTGDAVLDSGLSTLAYSNFLKGIEGNDTLNYAKNIRKEGVVVQYTEGNNRMVVLYDNYLCLLEVQTINERSSFNIVSAVELPYTEIDELAFAAAADSYLVVVGDWADGKTNGELIIADLLNGKAYYVTGSAGTERFSVANDGTMLAYAQDGTLHMLLLDASTTLDDVPFEGDMLQFGPDGALYMNSDTFPIDQPAVIYLDQPTTKQYHAMIITNDRCSEITSSGVMTVISRGKTLMQFRTQVNTQARNIGTPQDLVSEK